MTVMTIHEAFAKRKILAKRIPTKIIKLKVLGTKKKSSDEVDGIKKELFIKEGKESFQSLNDDIKLYKQLNQKIYDSNAKTKITICGEEYSILEALQISKFVIPEQEHLLDVLETTYKKLSHEVINKNVLLEDDADDFISKLVSDNSNNKNDFLEDRAKYIAQREWEIVDSINVLEYVNNEREKIEEFQSQLDSALSVSNATTTIQID